MSPRRTKQFSKPNKFINPIPGLQTTVNISSQLPRNDFLDVSQSYNQQTLDESQKQNNTIPRESSLDFHFKHPMPQNQAKNQPFGSSQSNFRNGSKKVRRKAGG